MKFFNRKEEVLDIQLTQYGKHLLSTGDLKPEFYAFFDDDVLYDGEYADVQENQNDIASRIKETPRPKVQYMFQSADKSVLEARQQIEREKKLGRSVSINLQPDADKHYALTLPIGTSGQGNKYLPSWDITSYGVHMSGSSETYDLFGISGSSGKPQIKIPQLDIDVKFKTIRAQNGAYEQIVEYPDGTIVAIEEDFVLLEVFENNGLTQNEEFELEVFEIEEEYDRNHDPISEKLHPLRFPMRGRQQRYIIDENNNAVLNPEYSDLPVASAIVREEVDVFQLVNTPEYENVEITSLVPYYFDVALDREVDPDLICKQKPADETRGRFARRMFKCRDTAGQEVVDNIYANLEEPDELCDDE